MYDIHMHPIVLFRDILVIRRSIGYASTKDWYMSSDIDAIKQVSKK